jgi:hypothetical protein
MRKEINGTVEFPSKFSEKLSQEKTININKPEYLNSGCQFN